jgi:hypothetical protein
LEVVTWLSQPLLNQVGRSPTRRDQQSTTLPQMAPVGRPDPVTCTQCRHRSIISSTHRPTGRWEASIKANGSRPLRVKRLDPLGHGARWDDRILSGNACTCHIQSTGRGHSRPGLLGRVQCRTSHDGRPGGPIGPDAGLHDGRCGHHSNGSHTQCCRGTQEARMSEVGGETTLVSYIRCVHRLWGRAKSGAVRIRNLLFFCKVFLQDQHIPSSLHPTKRRRPANSHFGRSNPLHAI